MNPTEPKRPVQRCYKCDGERAGFLIETTDGDYYKFDCPICKTKWTANKVAPKPKVK